MANNFGELNASELREKALNAYTVIEGSGEPNAYGVPDPTLTALNTTQASLAANITGVEAARAALDAEMEARDTDMDAILELLSTIGNVIYNNPDVTPEMIAAAGYAVRDEARTPIEPVTPTELVALPFADGTVKLKWNRNGGKYGMVYQVEARPDGSAVWSAVHTTTKQKATIPGFTPGVGTWLRVIAIKNDLSAPPSEPVAIYLGSFGEVLSLAA